MQDFFQSLLSSSTFTHFKQIIFKDNTKLSEDLSSDFKSLSEFLSKQEEPANFTYFLNTNPQFWLSPVLISVFSSYTHQSSSNSVLESSIDLLVTLIEHKEQIFFITEILFSSNGIIKNALRILREIQDNPSAPYQKSTVKRCLKLLESVSKIKLPGHFFIPELFQVILVFIRDFAKYSKKTFMASVNILENMLGDYYIFYLESSGPEIMIESFERSLEIQSPISIQKLLLSLISKSMSSPHTIISIQESSLLSKLKHLFMNKSFEVFPELLVFIHGLVTENPSMISEIMQNYTFLSLLESIKSFMPSNIKVIEGMLKLLASISSNAEGCQMVTRFSTLTNIVEALIYCKDELCNDLGVSIGENLQRICLQIPSAVEKCAEGCIRIFVRLKECENEEFSFLLENIGKVFKYCFCFATDITTEFFNRICFEDLLEIIQRPCGFYNTKNPFTRFLIGIKKLPDDLLSSLLLKTIHSLGSIFNQIEQRSGPLYLIMNFSQILSVKENLSHFLKSIENHIEILRIIVGASAVYSNYYQEFSNCFLNLSFLAKLIITEYTVLQFSNCSSPEVSIELKKSSKNIHLSILLTVSKLFGSCAQVCCLKPQKNVLENSAFCILKSLGEILGSLLIETRFSKSDSKLNYASSMTIELVSSIIFSTKTYTTSLLYSFNSALGMQSIYLLLADIKNCFRNIESVDKYLLDLWKSGLGFLRKLIKTKHSEKGKEHFLLISLGCTDAEVFIKQLKVEALFYLKQCGLEKSSMFYYEFKKVELDIVEYFIDNLEQNFSENSEKNKHYYHHVEKRQKLCRNVLENRGFRLKIETIVEDLIELLVVHHELYNKIAELLLKLSRSCELIQRDILESVLKHIHIIYIELQENELKDSKQLFALLQVVVYQQKYLGSHLLGFENELCFYLEGLLSKLRVSKENLTIFKTNFNILSEIYARNQATRENLVDYLMVFVKNLDFEVSQELLDSFFEFLIKVSSKSDLVEKANSKRLVKYLLRIRRDNTYKENFKEFGTILMNFYESKIILRSYFHRSIKAYLCNRKIYLHSFLDYFSESILKHKDIFLDVFFKICKLDTKFVYFYREFEDNSIENFKIIYTYFKSLYSSNNLISNAALIASITSIIKKHPKASKEIFLFYQSKNFDFFKEVVSRRFRLIPCYPSLDVLCDGKISCNEEFYHWLKTSFNLIKLLVLQFDESFNGKVIQSLKVVLDSDSILQDISLCKTLAFYLQNFIQLYEIKSSSFYKSLYELYLKIGLLISKINLKQEQSVIIFESLLESFELLKNSSLSYNDEEELEEEISESETSEELQLNHYYNKQEDQLSQSESEDESASDNIEESNSSKSSIHDYNEISLHEPVFDNALLHQDFMQIVELEIYEHFASHRQESSNLNPNKSQEKVSERRSESKRNGVNLVLGPKLSDSIFQVLIKSLYVESSINENLLSLVFLQFSQDEFIGKNVAMVLTEQLVVDGFERRLIGKGEYLYSILSIRILNILYHMVSLSLNVASSLVSKSPVFMILVRLFQNPLFKNSSNHLSILAKLFANIISKLGTSFPVISEPAMQSICNLLTSPLHTNSTHQILNQMICKLGKLPNNRATTIKCITLSLQKLVNFKGSLHSLKQLEILNLCKVLKSLGGCLEIIDYVWEILSEILISQPSPSSLLNFVPLIEAFIVCHLDRPNSASFQIFSLKTQKQINSLIKQHPSLLLNNFKYLVTRFTSLIDFENKRDYFRAEMREVQKSSSKDIIRLHVRRQEVFMDSYHQLKDREPSELCNKIRIQFVGEEGFDAGGLTREWYGLLSRAMFNANFALFIPSANGVSFQPNSMSSINREHIQFFKFVGSIIGKALCDGYPLDLYFTRSFYKHILGQEVNYQDMEDLDLDFYKSLKSLMDINLNESELHEYYFAYEEEEFGIHKIKELVPGGQTKRVTEENKIDYIKLLCHMKMTKNIQAQIDAFKSGFHELIPIDLISIFDSKELELLISGLPKVDLEDLKNNTDYQNYTGESQVIVWLWEVLYEFSHEERAEFIQFVTGSSKVPLEGFKALPGLGGTQKFQIHKSFASDDRLPTAHTCMNQLDLPEYPTKEKLKNRLKLAISEGKEGFGFI